MAEQIPPPSIQLQELELAGAVGLVVIRWGQIEWFSHQIAWMLWGWEPQAGRTITAGMPLPRLWRLIEVGLQGDTRHQNRLPSFVQWREDAQKLNTQRNNAVHSWWALELIPFPHAQDKPAASNVRFNASDYASTRSRRAGETLIPFDDWRRDLVVLAADVDRAITDLASLMWALVDTSK